MKLILRLIKFCWQALNFVRDLVMNVVFLFFVLLLAAVISLSAGMKKSAPLTGEQGALLLNLEGYLADNREEQLSLEDTLREINGQPVSHKISTFDVVYAIDTAAQDENIQGLVLDLNYFEGGDLPALEYIGKAITDFKAANKPVWVFSDNYTQAQYFLASFADQIYLNPIGQVAITGLAQENIYFKAMLDKLEITPHIFRVGTYKSAVEPFLRNDMSPEAKANMQQWLNGMWKNYVEIVAKNRDISTNSVLPEAKDYLAQLQALKGNSTVYAKQRKLVTKLATRLELEQDLTALFGENSEGKAKLLAFEDYLAAQPDRLTTPKTYKIATVNVEGTIIDGESDEIDVGGDTVARLLRRAYDDKNVKAVVLRVNSPGGSAFASEVIRQEIDNLQDIGKPVVVSMGSMAASGGYWISSTADYIVADKNTITGSIGIFAMFPTFEKSIKKLGMNADGVKTTDLAEGSAFSPLDKSVADIYQLEIEHGYDQFLTVVSQGRNLSKAQVDKIAQGQVWLGEDAYKHKLVDELGDFDTAVRMAYSLIADKGELNEEELNDIGVEWIVDDEISPFKQFLRDLKHNAKMRVTELFALPVEVKQVQRQLNLLSKFNDPKGQYLYCLTCSEVK